MRQYIVFFPHFSGKKMAAEAFNSNHTLLLVLQALIPKLKYNRGPKPLASKMRKKDMPSQHYEASATREARLHGQLFYNVNHPFSL